MSYKAKEIIDSLVDVGVIFESNEDEVMEYLESKSGIDILHDIVITSDEAREIRGLLCFLSLHEDEYIRSSANWCAKLLEKE